MHSNLNVYELLTHNIAAAGYTNEVMIAKGDSLNAAKVVPNRSQDWIYIDADHSYYAVRADIEAWSDKVKLGGILCGHDYDRHHPGVVEAADEIGADSTGRIWWKTIGEGE